MKFQALITLMAFCRGGSLCACETTAVHTSCPDASSYYRHRAREFSVDIARFRRGNTSFAMAENKSELACVYAALILHDDGVEITVREAVGRSSIEGQTQLRCGMSGRHFVAL